MSKARQVLGFFCRTMFSKQVNKAVFWVKNAQNPDAGFRIGYCIFFNLIIKHCPCAWQINQMCTIDYGLFVLNFHKYINYCGLTKR